MNFIKRTKMDCNIISVNHSIFFEVIEILKRFLEGKGHTVKVTDLLDKDFSEFNIVIKAGRPFEQSQIKGKRILFQTEGLWNRRAKGVYDLSNKYDLVLDMFEDNAKIKKGTKNVKYCPVTYSEVFENEPVDKYEYDVFFYGSLTPRRSEICNELNKLLLKKGIRFLCSGNSYMGDRNDKIMRSKIILNIKASDIWHYAPLHNLPAQCNKKLLLSENPDGSFLPYEESKHFIGWDNVDDLYEKIVWWLENEEERKLFTENAYIDLKTNHHINKYLEVLLKDILK